MSVPVADLGYLETGRVAEKNGGHHQSGGGDLIIELR
jgi:hypothetical protein